MVISNGCVTSTSPLAETTKIRVLLTRTVPLWVRGKSGRSPEFHTLQFAMRPKREVELIEEKGRPDATFNCTGPGHSTGPREAKREAKVRVPAPRPAAATDHAPADRTWLHVGLWWSIRELRAEPPIPAAPAVNRYVGYGSIVRRNAPSGIRTPRTSGTDSRLSLGRLESSSPPRPPITAPGMEAAAAPASDCFRSVWVHARALTAFPVTYARSAALMTKVETVLSTNRPSSLLRNAISSATILRPRSSQRSARTTVAASRPMSTKGTHCSARSIPSWIPICT